MPGHPHRCATTRLCVRSTGIRLSGLYRNGARSPSRRAIWGTTVSDRDFSTSNPGIVARIQRRETAWVAGLRGVWYPEVVQNRQPARADDSVDLIEQCSPTRPLTLDSTVDSNTTSTLASRNGAPRRSPQTASPASTSGGTCRSRHSRMSRRTRRTPSKRLGKLLAFPHQHRGSRRHRRRGRGTGVGPPPRGA